MLRFHTCLEHFAACQISTCTWLCNQNIQPEKLITQGLQSLGLHHWAVKVEVQNLLWWALKINQGKAAWWVFPALQGKLVTDWEQTGSTTAADNTNKLYSLIEKGKKKKKNPHIMDQNHKHLLEPTWTIFSKCMKRVNPAEAAMLSLPRGFKGMISKYRYIRCLENLPPVSL